MKTSENVNELATALVKAQASYGSVTKDATNPHFKSKYATLANIFDAVIPSLTANGLALVQGTRHDGPMIHVITRLIHTSGQWIETEVSITPMKPDAQAVGSAITYGRRYGMALVGICAEDDDDGNEAVGRPTQRGSQATPPAKARGRQQQQEEQPEPPASIPSATKECLEFGRQLAVEYADLGFQSAADAKRAAKEWFASKGLNILEVVNPAKFDECLEAIATVVEGVIE